MVQWPFFRDGPKDKHGKHCPLRTTPVEEDDRESYIRWHINGEPQETPKWSRRRGNCLPEADPRAAEVRADQPPTFPVCFPDLSSLCMLSRLLMACVPGSQRKREYRKRKADASTAAAAAAAAPSASLPAPSLTTPAQGTQPAATPVRRQILVLPQVLRWLSAASSSGSSAG